MESVKKWLTERSIKKNALFVHHNLPKLVGTVPSIQLRQWARTGADNKLERAILAGQGRRLLAEAETLLIPRHLYNLIYKCEALHNAVEKGSVLELQEVLENDYNRQKLVMCLDEAGVGLLHKAIYYDYLDIAEYLVSYYPQLVHQKDSEGRTALHYTAASRDEAAAAALLERAGATRGARDAAGRTLAHYRAARTLLALPAPPPPDMSPQNNLLVIKRHNIRIWCHECDMGRLQRVVWEGQGSRLLSEVSSQPVVKRFLEAVPYIMNTIRDAHNAVIKNDLEGVMRLSGDPVPPQLLSSRDTNNMTVLHKAAGLGYNGILKYILERYPQGVNDIDNDGRTPLHYAAGVRDDQHTYNTLVDAGADESIVDNKNKTPGYYINRPNEIDKNIFKTLPEAPRTPSSAYPSSWDWKILNTESIADFNKKIRKKNLKASSENISSKNNTNTTSEHTENNNGMKGSNTYESIKNLPELNEIEKVNISNGNENHEESENNKDAEEDNENKETQEPIKDLKCNEKLVDEIKNTENNETSNDETHSKVDEPENNDKEDEIIPANTVPEDNEKKTDSDIKLIEDSKNDHIDIENNKIDQNEETPDETDKNNTNNDDPHETDSVTVNDKNEKQQENNTHSDPQDQTSLENHINHSTEENNQGNISQDNDTTQSKNLENNQGETSPKSSTDHSESKDKEENQENKDILENEEQEDTETVLNNTNQNTDKSLNYLSGNKEEDSQSSTNEGNIGDRNEDDDDVQVQGNSHQDESSIVHSVSAKVKQSNGSAKRGNLSNGGKNQESLIEGIISSEAEQETLDASILQKGVTATEDILIVDNEIDPEVTDLINTANMEMLATLVLNGEGSRLIGRHSTNLELQAFLDNVPTYMQKINKVHIAAKEGNLRDLQAALDRRKFAIARDPISPNGATPLHVATVFGKTSIVKYLGGRFPETLSAVDFEGRTALHYAAVLPDNGHYYNLLQQLGSNSKDLDDSGKSAENFYQNPTLFPVNHLLKDFGISEDEAKTMFADKGVTHPANGHLDTPIFHTEEGRYLAKSLGDPLIKGLTEVANIKPKDPVAFLATFLHNFPEQEKVGAQASNLFVMKGPAEVDNDQPPPEDEATDEIMNKISSNAAVRSAARTTTRPHRPIEVVTVDPQNATSPDAPEIAFSSANRDEHGQSMLHFASARAHTNNALLQLLQESDVSLAYRDELYRTARDISIQANVLDNTSQIDKFVLQLAARGNKDAIMDLLLQGYDHILDIVDEEGVPITDVISKRGDQEMSNLLASIPAFEESRENLHRSIRTGDLLAVKSLLSSESGRTLARAHNALGRTALHTAVLAQDEDIVDYLAETFPELLRVGDNLERTPLHYAMGVEKMESLSRVLIRAGAKRVLKDLKGRQPSYYFMNKSDILRLKEEEEAY